MTYNNPTFRPKPFSRTTCKHNTTDFKKKRKMDEGYIDFAFWPPPSKKVRQEKRPITFCGTLCHVSTFTSCCSKAQPICHVSASCLQLVPLSICYSLIPLCNKFNYCTKCKDSLRSLQRSSVLLHNSLLPHFLETCVPCNLLLQDY